MTVYLAVAAGGALGALSRYGLMSLVTQWWPLRFPLGTLAVNIAGSLLIGVLYVLITEKMLLSAEWRALLTVGYLGAFTTFSTFSLDALLLLQQGQLALAAFYIFASVGICLAAVWLGMALMRLA